MDQLVTRRAGPLGVRVGLGLLLLGLCTACGQGSSPETSPATAATAPAIPTTPPAGSLTWTPHTPPVTAPQPQGVSGRLSLAVPPSDGQMAYLCAPAGTRAPRTVSLWLTRDGGVTWTPTAPVVVTVPGPIAPGTGPVIGCDMITDDVQPGTLVARASLPSVGCMACTNAVAYVTTDYAAHWSLLRFPSNRHSYLRALATRGSVSYAIFGIPPASATPADDVFVKSTDGMRTWTTVPVPIVGAAQAVPQTEQVMQLWLNPYNGALLVETSNSYFNDEHFWVSSTGTRWTALPAPPFPFAVGSFVVQQPFTAAPWHICGGDPAAFGTIGQNANTHSDDLACTADSGAHWVTRHIDFATHDGDLPDYTLVTIADDGGLLFSNGPTLERFAIGTDGVESLGPVPNAGLILYASGGGAGMLWAGPADSYPDADPQGRIFTASYA
jgi:hypothetical protein